MRPLEYGRFRDNPAHPENGALRQVDDGCKRVDSVRAKVRNRERTAPEMFRAQVTLPRLLNEVRGYAGEIGQVSGARVRDDGNEKAGVGIHGNADVDLLVPADGPVLPGGVQVGMVGEREGGHFYEEIVVRQQGDVEFRAQCNEVRRIGIGGKRDGAPFRV